MQVSPSQKKFAITFSIMLIIQFAAALWLVASSWNFEDSTSQATLIDYVASVVFFPMIVMYKIILVNLPFGLGSLPWLMFAGFLLNCAVYSYAILGLCSLYKRIKTVRQ